MHRRKVIVERKGLNDRIMTAKFMAQRKSQFLKRISAFVASVAAAMSRNAERNIVVLGPNRAGFAMIVIGTCHKPTVNFSNKSSVYRAVGLKFCDPTIGLDRCMCLPLRPRKQFFRALLQCHVQFPVRKISTFNSRCSGDLAF